MEIGPRPGGTRTWNSSVPGRLLGCLLVNNGKLDLTRNATSLRPLLVNTAKGRSAYNSRLGGLLA